MANRTVLIYPDPESDYWVAECPSLPVCVSQGKTRQEALLNIKEAIELHVECLRETDMTTRKVIIRAGESGFFIVTVPSLPGCISQGKTRQEAIENIREAIRVYIESLEEDGIPVPTDEYETVQATRLQPPEQ